VNSRAWIALVGPPAAGKTTFARHLTRIRSEFCHASDLAALQELFALDANVPIRPFYWPDLEERATNAKGRTKPLPDGGHDIIDPSVWDEALLRVIARFRVEPAVVLEFARGSDMAYLSHHGLSLSGAYQPSFQLLERALRTSPATPFAIVHVSAPFSVRVERNARRRVAGDHFVAEEVMKSVYEHDVLQDQHRSLGASTAVGVYVVDGTLPSEPAVRNFLTWWDSQILTGSCDK
jgi:hypothetical protein